MPSPALSSPNSPTPLPASAIATDHQVDYAQLEGPIAVDDAYDKGATSDYSSDLSESDMTSLKSSILDYVYENGRRYHAYNSGKYILPNDESEQDRLDLHHHIFLLALDGKITTVPLPKDIQRVLDLGTGTGIWAVDCADQYPAAEVIGTDLSPIQPLWVPPNCTFEVDDAEQPWLWPENHFDFIHSRNLTQSIRNWTHMANSMFKHTKPGGYVELCELEGELRCDDGTVPENSCIRQYMKIWQDAAKEMGIPQPSGEDLKNYLEKAGFVDVQLRTFKHPFGTWPKDEKMKILGRYNLLQAQAGFQAYGVALFTRADKMSTEEANALSEECVKEMFDKKKHSYNNVWYIVGRKPERDE